MFTPVLPKVDLRSMCVKVGLHEITYAVRTRVRVRVTVK